MKKYLNVQIENRIATVTLSNGRLNLLNYDALGEIRDIFDELSRDRELIVVILTGEGENFSGGADVNDFTKTPRRMNSPYGQMVTGRPEACPLACDIRIASETARIGLVEAKIGHIAGYGRNNKACLVYR